jgi:hypothetical protein
MVAVLLAAVVGACGGSSSNGTGMGGAGGATAGAGGASAGAGGHNDAGAGAAGGTQGAGGAAGAGAGGQTDAGAGAAGGTQGAGGTVGADAGSDAAKSGISSACEACGGTACPTQVSACIADATCAMCTTTDYRYCIDNATPTYAAVCACTKTACPACAAFCP